MTAFLKIDTCQTCRRDIPWEWVPAVLLNGKALAGTGVWRSQMVDHVCPDCLKKHDLQREKARCDQTHRKILIDLFGGEKPYREFTFERYRVLPGNQIAYESAKRLDPAADNLYLWGPCGVGKTHLAYATARRCFEETLSVAVLRAFQLSRLVRMKEALQEAALINEWIGTEFLAIEDLGAGTDTAFNRQILVEILDGRDFQDRAGLVVTSRYSLSGLAQHLGDDAIPSRLAAMCRVIRIQGEDRRQRT